MNLKGVKLTWLGPSTFRIRKEERDSSEEKRLRR